MGHHLACSLWFTVLATAVAFEGCNKPSPAELDRLVQPAAAQAATTDQARSRPAEYSERKTVERLSAPSAPPLEAYKAEHPPPWLAELLHSPDPNLRIQALDAWARHPSMSLDPVTYALVDPDDSVRARAQALF